MMRMTVLASGSRGNSTVIASSRTRILVDAGLSCRELIKRMQQAEEDPSRLDAILITHEHQDHVQGLSVAARRLGIPVYFTEATHRAWLRWMTPRKRLTYADWLGQRQAEAVARKAAPQAAPQGQPAETTHKLPAEQKPAASESENPFYREHVLRDCCAEEEELAREAVEAAMPGPESRVAAATVAGCPPLQLVDAANAAPLAVSAAVAAETLCEEKRPAADPCALPGVEYFRSGVGFVIGDIEIMPFTIPHDAVDPVGFVFKAEGIRIGLATDLGYMPANVSQQLRGCDVVMLESNHDLDMLRDGPYPWSVKQRVLSRVGHLSNTAASEFLEKGYDGEAAYVVLAHLSESNNLPALARVSAEFGLRNRMSLLANKLVLAAQDVPTESICL